MRVPRKALLPLIFAAVFLLGRGGWTGDWSGPFFFQETGPAASSWAEKIRVSGAFRGDFRWRQYADFLNQLSAPATDLYIRELDLGVQTDVGQGFSATLVLNSEWLGDDLNQGDEKAAVDEVHVDLNLARLPFYFVLGKRSQPVGLFENYLITDPLTMDLYETQKVGITAGFTGPLETDVSLTLYKGAGQLDHMLESGLIDVERVTKNPLMNDRVNSWILAGALTPWKQVLNIFGALVSEPGTSRRNTGLNLGFNFSLPGHPNFKFDGEFMKALSREPYAGSDQEFRESALSVTATYSFVLRPRRFRGTGNYAGRRATARAFPFTASLRYEHFDDGGLTASLDAWTIRERASLGGRYTFFETGSALGYFQLEYRTNRFRVPPRLTGQMTGNQNEVYVRLGFLF
jgi:hypothetical protein